MKIEGRITLVKRVEVNEKDRIRRIYTTADVTWEQTALNAGSGFGLSGYEPEVTFQIGQVITLEIGDVPKPVSLEVA